MELNNINKTVNMVEEVMEGSIAEELEIEPGDILISVNGEEVEDIIDYKYIITDDFVELVIQKPDGEVWELEIEKEYDEDLGISFTNPLIDKAKSCKNKCIFCFIDQLPKGMRETLYFKDDDSRLSFLQGNFITLTNLNDEEIERIIRYRISPINISVHTTNPDLRVKMLNNKNAGKLYDILKRFNEVNIEMNCQIVLVPNVNDGKELDRTIEDLSKLYPNVNSMAVVPIGVTKYREGLEKVEIFDKEKSEKLINQIEEKQKQFLDKINTRFVFASDEFYVLANRETPQDDDYEGYPQIENGVGLMRSFQTEIEEELQKINETKSNKQYIIPTGAIAYDFMVKISKLIMDKFEGLKIKVIPIKNKFFGETITVTGLITAGDLIEQLKDEDLKDGILISRCMMKADEEIFLDNITLKELEEKLNTKVIVSKTDGKEFVNIFKNN